MLIKYLIDWNNYLDGYGDNYNVFVLMKYLIDWNDYLDDYGIGLSLW